MFDATFYLNGDYETQGAKVDLRGVTTFDELFQKALVALNLTGIDLTLTRVFDQDGVEIKSIPTIQSGSKLYFSAGEDFVSFSDSQNPISPSHVPATAPIQEGEQEASYLTNAAAWSASMLSSSYGYFSHAVRTNCSPGVVNTFNSIENNVAAYGKPIVDATKPYAAAAVGWTDQQLNKGLAAATEHTNAFLQTEAGQKVSATMNNVSEFSRHAHQSFVNATIGRNNNNAEDQEGDVQTEEEHKESYIANLKESLGDKWHNSLLPAAYSVYGHFQQYVPQAAPSPTAGDSSAPVDTENLSPKQI